MAPTASHDVEVGKESAAAVEGDLAPPLATPQDLLAEVTDPSAQACGLKVKHPDWTDKKIAQIVGLGNKTWRLTRSGEYQRTKASVQGELPPPGWKNGDSGDIEAIEE
jgi:hypothetical protein